LFLRPAIIGLALAIVVLFALFLISEKSGIPISVVEQAIAPTGEQLPPVLFPMFPDTGFFRAEEMKPLHASITVEKAPKVRDVSPGNTIEFRISVRNTGNGTLHDLAVEERYDSSKLTITKAPGSIIGENRILWKIPVLHAGQLWTANYVTEISQSSPAGAFETTAYVLGKDVEDLPGSSRMASSQMTIVSLPAAGAELNWFWRVINELMY
jgi:hypothetical protein